MNNKLLLVFSYLLVFCLGWFLFPLINTQDTQTEFNKLKFNETTNSIIISNDIPDQSYLKNLQNLLSEYESKIENLVDSNNLLQSKLSLLDNQKTVMSFLPSFRKKIENMSEKDVKDSLYKLFKKEEQLSKVNDHKAFAMRFVDLAVEEDELPENLNERNVIQDVRISISRSTDSLDFSTENFHVSKFYKLYGVILADPPLKDLVLKWKNLNTGEIIKYQVISFSVTGDIQYVWARPNAGWDVGVYQISLHELNDDMSIIARKLYRISSVVDEGPEPINNGPALIKG